MSHQKELGIGFMGLGSMGTGIASNLYTHCHQTTPFFVQNRTLSQTEQFVQNHQAAIPIENPQQLGSKKCSIVFSCLANDDALLSVFSAFLSGRSEDSPQCIYVDCSTVLPATTHHLAALASQHANLQYLHCPVFGRPDAASTGKLFAVISGGTLQARETIQRLICSSFAQNGVLLLDDEPSTATAVKLIGNSFIVGQIEIASQTLALASKANVPTDKMLNVIEYLNGAAPIPNGYTHRIAHGNFSSGDGFTVNLGLKDVSHIQTFAREVACPCPIVDLANNHLLTAQAKFGGDLDWGAIGLAVKDAAGIPIHKPSGGGEGTRS